MTIELKPQEYTAFQNWKAVNEKQQQERKRGLQKLSPLVIEAIHLFSRLAIEVQLTQKASAFVRMSGHIQSVELEIYMDGWSPNHLAEFSLTVYSFSTESLDQLKDILKEKIGALDLFTPEYLDFIINQ